jgi:hypothetical protein
LRSIDPARFALVASRACPSGKSDDHFLARHCACKVRKLQKSYAPKARIVEAIQADLGCPDPRAEIFRFSPPSIGGFFRIVPPHTEGRFAIVTNVRRDAMDAGGAADESAGLADGEVAWS